MVSQAVASGDPTNKDWLIRKYDSSGTKLWEQTVDGKGLDDWPRGILFDSEDNVIICGNLNNGTDNGDNAHHDAYFVKYAKDNGDVLWAKTWDSGQSDIADDMVADSKGNFYVSGRMTNTDGKFKPMMQYRDGENGELLKFQDLPYVTTQNNKPTSESYGAVTLRMRNGKLVVSSTIYGDDTLTDYRYTGYIALLQLVPEGNFPWTMFLPAIINGADN